MKIAMIVNSYPPRVGGLEYHIHDLAHALADRGHDISVVTLNREPSERSESNVRVFTKKAHLPIADVITVPSLGTRRKLTHWLRETNFDLVSVHTRFFPMTFVGIRAAERAGLPVILTEHGSGFVVSPSRIITLGSKIVDLTFGRYAMTHADTCLAVSLQSQSFVKYLAGREAIVFPNAVNAYDLSSYLPHRPDHLVFVGRMVPGKGWDTFIEVVADVRQSFAGITAELIGSGPDIDAARNRVHALGLDDVISVRGQVSPEEVQQSLKGAILVNPSILAEGFQTTLLEAIVSEGRAVSYPVPSALMLQEEGAPVCVCHSKTRGELVEAVKGMISSPPPTVSAEDASRWTWPTRAGEYEALAIQAIQGYR